MKNGKLRTALKRIIGQCERKGCRNKECSTIIMGGIATIRLCKKHYTKFVSSGGKEI